MVGHGNLDMSNVRNLLHPTVPLCLSVQINFSHKDTKARLVSLDVEVADLMQCLSILTGYNDLVFGAFDLFVLNKGE